MIETIKYFFHLYGRRNRIFLPGLMERINYLNLGICDLQDAVRKEEGQAVIGITLARVTARIFCIAEHFWNIPANQSIHMVEVMCQKYPASRCSYCQEFPCQCPERRTEAVLEPIHGEQLNWSFNRWQEHLRSLYGNKNRERGIENILNRLFKETGELLSLQMRIPNMGTGLAQIEKEFALELADALAWTMAVASFFEIDLQQEVLERYGNGCWSCHQSPCCCTNFNLKPMQWASA